MWVPRDTAEIEDAAQRDDLEETPSFDAKRELPVSAKRNIDVAIDVAAMSTEGGVLLYGIAEDENKRPTILAPLPLAGAADRIGEIVAKSIAEVPYIDVREYKTEHDEALGYLAVIVPQSARAPHQVTVGDDRRFYGRGAKGNRRLSEGEIALLYQRRQEWEQNRDELLAEAVAQAPFTPQETFAYLHAFARPVSRDRGIWERAAEAAGGRSALQQILRAAATSAKPVDVGDPNLKSAANWRRRGADEWRLSSSEGRDSSDPRTARYTASVRINIDGRGHLFCGRAGEISRRDYEPEDAGFMLLFESIIAGNFAAFLAMMGTLFRTGGYFGHVDVGLVVTGLRGGVGHSSRDRSGFYDDAKYEADSYPRHDRVSAAELDQPEQVAWRLLRHLMDALSGREDFNPFES
jgi:hypothetical protein